MAVEQTFEASREAELPGPWLAFISAADHAAWRCLVLAGISFADSQPGQRWHVHAMDLRGHGQSGWTPDTYCLQAFTKDNVEFLDQLNAPAVLVGHSVGGVIALMVAARRPDKVRALIIEDVPVSLDGYRHEVEAGRERFGRWLHLKRSAQSELDLALKQADLSTSH